MTIEPGMSDRAEQAKALIEESENLRERHMYTSYAPWKDAALPLIDKLTAALTASEAEVTRLETGIAEALALESWHPESYGGPEHAVVYAHDVRAALSQPTTDTNGAHE